MLKVLFIFGLFLHSHFAIPVGKKETPNNDGSEEMAPEKTPSELAISKLNLPSNSTYIRADITDSGFSCENKSYGYYADIENDCQIFHVCLPVKYADGKESLFRWSFICPEETIFSQDSFTCMRSEDMIIQCEESADFFDLNSNFGMPIEEKPEDKPIVEMGTQEKEKAPEPELPKPVSSTTVKPTNVYRRKPTNKPLRLIPTTTISSVHFEEIQEKLKQEIIESVKPQDVVLEEQQTKTKIPEIENKNEDEKVELNTETKSIVEEQKPVELEAPQQVDSVKVVAEESVPSEDSVKPSDESTKSDDSVEPNDASSETDIVSALIDSLTNDDDEEETPEIPEIKVVPEIKVENTESIPSYTNVEADIIDEPVETKKDDTPIEPIAEETKIVESNVEKENNLESNVEKQTNLFPGISIDDVIGLVKDSLDSTTNINNLESQPEEIVPIYNRDNDSKIIVITKPDESSIEPLATQSTDSKIIPIEIKEQDSQADSSKNKTRRHLKFTSRVK